MTPTRTPPRLLVAVLVALQTAAPLGAALADHGPVARTAHETHVSSSGEAGCEPIHGEFDCLLCRVLSAHPLAGHAIAAPTAAGPALTLPTPSPAVLPARDGACSQRLARAPPIS